MMNSHVIKLCRWQNFISSNSVGQFYWATQERIERSNQEKHLKKS
jgi:hypothetical protein